MSQIASIQAVSCLHARAGAFVLPAAQALALRPKEPSSIRITCGTAWVTIDDGVDYFLAAGQQITALAGSRVVMESMRPGGQLKFDWQPVEQTQRERSALRGRSDTLAEPDGLSPLTQALRDLRGAATLAARGVVGLAGALLAGLARGFADVLAAGLAARARSAHSSASCAQGRMAS
jgi:hypothetical protein